MTRFIKICGITDLEAAQVSAEAGADAIGFVFSPSPREIHVPAARVIADAVRDRLQIVAVFRDEPQRHIRQVVDGLEPDIVQADFHALPDDLEVGVLPVIREGQSGSVPEGMFLYEGARSGVGRSVDAEVARDIATRGSMVLAGGLTPLNVGRLIRGVRPYGVDVSSGVEVAPGLKDPQLIESFISEALSELESVR